MKVQIKETVWREYIINEDAVDLEKIKEIATTSGAFALEEALWGVSTNKLLLDTGTTIEPTFTQQNFPTITVTNNQDEILWENGEIKESGSTKATE